MCNAIPSHLLQESVGPQISRHVTSMTGFKSFRNASVPLAWIELAHRIRKRQFSFGLGRQRIFMTISLDVVGNLVADRGSARPGTQAGSKPAAGLLQSFENRRG
jgi:hypothetical protein